MIAFIVLVNSLYICCQSLLVECRRLQGVVSKVEEEHAIEMGELQSEVQYLREGYEQVSSTFVLNCFFPMIGNRVVVPSLEVG